MNVFIRRIIVFFILNEFFLVKYLMIFKLFVLNMIGIFKKNENFVVIKCEVLIKIVFRIVVLEWDVLGISVKIWNNLIRRVVWYVKLFSEV